ncbi:hypothetical protein F7725_013115 [Dissostichus mawsoni]|uniref:Uncharacterized protein n=1 Tax=Dissostichus mawsoni TaxID=36200 RepID=A0A7J5YQF5_DISMA|nr:hypothetical protein F7725_013115 [Dissostichus mawsoni]
MLLQSKCGLGWRVLALSGATLLCLCSQDRIVFRSRQADDIRAFKYTCCSSIKTSDHRPVISVFQVKLRPGRDNIPLGAGQFDRGLYLEGIRRRITRELKRREAMKGESTSTICTIS